MQPNPGPSELTFTEAARRKQIVTAAIETIAELGYGRASFARIAKRAGLSSPGLISYHFAGKDDLIEQVVAEVYAVGGAVVRPRADAAATAMETLRGYIEGSIAFYDTHRSHMKALVQILLGHPEARGRWFDEPNAAELDGLEGLLARGQRDGEFREFPPRTVAVIIRQLLSGALQHLLTEPDLDLAGYTRELVAVCEHAVRATHDKET
ncbi:TetR family transcriptional regulator [Herbihabitans rhizosphaerae]|uniref:TetR family transcriptional regulator n=1 Tax=Herbihabitans rhizosphaerae TaxID=1872711 RepID=A0A4V2ESY6_9PSEU|nr:TetR family transcriptional regulator [Herbihabitans rhizosphaerae]RZS39203.1 TetR family transcriptional regulator [Herbihabitans rhizosphaerae]